MAAAAPRTVFLAPNKEGMRLLTNERSRASFNVRDMTHLINGSREETERKERLAQIVETTPALRADDRYFLTRPQQMSRALEKFKTIVKLVIGKGMSIDDGRTLYDYMGEPMPISLHYGMFIPTIQSQGTQEQKEKWLPLAQSYTIIGCYAQTEMGHGSNVRGLETTATYEKATEEFVLNSPTLTSMKWWPGGMGVCATHAVTHARLLIDGTDHGVHTFIVQLRDTETHEPLPGITVGDIGPKFGWNMVDNGYLAFDHVRIPRDQMLSRYRQVMPDGKYISSEHEKVQYGTMIYIRALLVADAFDALARACTIAVRYSAVRRQGGDGPKGEMQVLDYQMQQYRLMPLVATAYAFLFTGKYMTNLYNQLKNGMEDNDLSVLPEVHATSAGLKALVTIVTSDGIEEARKSCGGHGFSHFSGLPYLFQFYVPAATFEGDSIILSLQTARFLIKCRKQGIAGVPLVGSVRYIVESSGERCPAHSAADLLKPELLVEMYAHRARSLVIATDAAIQADVDRGVAQEDALNANMVELVKMNKAHCTFVVVRNFANAIPGVEDDKLRAVLTRLLCLYALYNIEKDIGDFLQNGYLVREQSAYVGAAVRMLLRELRPDAVSLVDAFNFPDFQLNSSLGRYDGDVYEHMYKWAQQDEMNSNPAARFGYRDHLKPVMDKSVFMTASL